MSKFWQDKQILVTGGAGFLGSHVVTGLQQRGVPRELISVPRSAEHDLRKWAECVEVTRGQDLVIHIAGNVGGIGYNLANPGALFFDNMMMGVQLMEAARQNGVDKLVAIGTVCAYPKITPVPFTDDDLWNGYPEETNAPYGLAKKMLLVQSQAYRQQYGFDAIYLLLVNLYGPGDDYDPRSSHVIPAIIKKAVDAVLAGGDEIVLWGDGSSTREFLYVEDAAEAILLAAQHYSKPDPVNLGSSFEISIRNLVEIIAHEVGFHGHIQWDVTLPNGQPRRKLKIDRAEAEFGFRSKVGFEEGLRRTIQWYLAQSKMDTVEGMGACE